ncbi:hypothetical protein ACPOL_6765 (plasmid) [Acidisarcina polymorpha]|uniref:Uncharacterized protein n=1 Tax=Acidisarcina polymorpha TaxID=2211140 RepID=A0A2Z5GBG4_9BACT|nr:hypothetical protein [Acidisarcina polymorpha]AXC15975.1 hypothetical protein ACPOL_6765 [Acidisarcina polymorpha]
MMMHTTSVALAVVSHAAIRPAILGIFLLIASLAPFLGSAFLIIDAFNSMSEDDKQLRRLQNETARPIDRL